MIKPRPPLPKIRDRVERPFNEKYSETMEIIRHHLEEFKLGEMPVAWSGGKDSTLLLYLVHTLEPEIPVVFENTGVEAPETIRFIRRITEEWGLKLVELHPFVVAVAGGVLAGTTARWVMDEVRISRLVREKLGPYRKVN